MLWLLAAMMGVLLTWLVVGSAFTGIGLLVQRCIGRREIDSGGLLRSFWLGFAAVILILQLWNFVLPVNAISEGVVLALGMIGLLIHARAIGNWLKCSCRSNWVAILIVGVLALWIANRAIGPANADDNGLYHFSAILWAKSYPVVPGVGNLAATLAMNNASFLYTAMLDHGPWAGRSEHIANSLLLFVFCVQILRSMALIARGCGWLPENVYFTFMAPVVLMLAVAKDASSPRTDLPAGIIMVVIGAWFLRFVLMPPRDERRADRLIALAILCSVAVCLKLSMIVLAAAVGVIAVAIWLHAERPTIRLATRTIAILMVVVTLFIGSWVGRSIIMSGYPLFPSRVLPVQVEWRVPEPAVFFLEDAIRKHAKGGLPLWMYEITSERKWLSWYASLVKPPFDTREGAEGWNWVRPWLVSLPLTSPIEIVMPMMAAVISVGVLAWRRLHRRSQPLSQNSDRVGIISFRPGFLLIIPTLAALVFWCIAGPDPRYGWPAAWMLGALLTTFAVVNSNDGPLLSKRMLQTRVALLILASLSVFGYRTAVQLALGRQNPLHEVLVYGPGSDYGLHPRPTSEMTSLVNRWGMTIHVPTGERPYHCFNGPLPCTGWPPLDPDLRERKPGDLRAGFVIDRSPASHDEQAQ